LLRPFVERLLIVEFPAAEMDAHLPDIGMFARFQLKGSCVLPGKGEAPQAGITGLWDRTRVHNHSQNSAVLLVAFTATGAASVVRHPADEFGDTTVPLGSILDHPADLARVHQQLAEARNHAARFQAVENFLLARLANAARPDPLVTAAVSKIKESQGMLRIEDLTSHIGLSQSALERRFSKVVGTPPKQFASTVRLHHVLELRETGADLTWIAHAVGYYDQSHFIKDFKHATGLAPQSFFQNNKRIKRRIVSPSDRQSIWGFASQPRGR
jgi:AraC-like DNA-binding protein